jgi:hypothetical protein
LWNGGMDEETAKRAIAEISRLKMAEAAWYQSVFQTKGSGGQIFMYRTIIVGTDRLWEVLWHWVSLLDHESWSFTRDTLDCREYGYGFRDHCIYQ